MVMCHHYNYEIKSKYLPLAMIHKDTPLYTFQFLILCVSYGLFGASFNMIIPELPSYLASLGGENYKGLIISLFTLTAGISRPISGKLADTIGRVPVIVTGAIVCVFCSLLYPLLAGVAGFLILRLFHGFSTGFTPTAITAYVADIVPDTRRGEAMGIVGVSMNLGASISPPIGSYLVLAFSLDILFYVSSFIAFVSMLLLLRMKETLVSKEDFHPRQLILNRNEIIDKDSIVPAIICGLTYFGLGVILTIVADQCEFMGIKNKGIFFTSFTVCSILSRLVAGQISDRFGRIEVIVISIFCLVCSNVFMAMATTPVLLISATGCIGFSLGIAAPALFAWTIDRSDVSRRGMAMGTMYIGLEVAIGLGALISAAIYANNPANFDVAFYVTAGITSIAFYFLYTEYKARQELQ